MSHISICFELAFRYFINNVVAQELLTIFFGVLLINVEGPKKKVKQLAREIEKFLGAKQLSLQNLFKGYQVKTDSRFSSEMGKDGYMVLKDSKKSSSQSEPIF